jgi:hypothetical protein
MLCPIGCHAMHMWSAISRAFREVPAGGFPAGRIICAGAVIKHSGFGCLYIRIAVVTWPQACRCSDQEMHLYLLRLLIQSKKQCRGISSTSSSRAPGSRSGAALLYLRVCHAHRCCCWATQYYCAAAAGCIMQQQCACCMPSCEVLL